MSFFSPLFYSKNSKKLKYPKSVTTAGKKVRLQFGAPSYAVVKTPGLYYRYLAGVTQVIARRGFWSIYDFEYFSHYSCEYQ